MADLEHGLTIHELELAETISGDSFVAIDDGTNTKKAKIANLNSASATSAQTYAEAAAASAASSASSATQAQTSAQSVQSAMVQATSQLQGYVDDAAASASSAAASEANIRGLITSDYAKLARSYATGDSGYREGEETDNAKYYSEQSESYVDDAAAQAVIAGQKADLAEDHAEESEDHALESEGHALGTQNGTPVSSDSPYYHNNAKYWADEARQASAGGVAASVIATAEPTNISTHAYAIGDQFVYNGILYTATSAISVGATITPGTNCSISDTITEQIGNAGHTILDEDGTTYPQRSKLKFNGFTVTDDSTNDETIVDIDPTLRDAEVIEGKNLFSETYTNRFVFGSTQNGYNINGNANGFVAIGKVEPGNDYVVSKNNLGNAFRVVLFKTYPVYTVSQLDATQLISEQDTSRTDYSFTVPSTYNYVAVGFNRDSAYTGSITPMLCTLEEWQKSHDYEPYYIPVKDAMLRRSEQRVLGAKNLLKNDLVSQVINGVTFTKNADDKTVNVTRTAEQTEVAISDLYVVSDEDYKLLAGKTLLMTGCPSGGSNDTYYLECFYNDGTGHWLRDIGNGLKITLPATKPTTIRFLIGIKVSSVIPSGGLTFKPMLRLASDPDNTYVPYVMTNRELTDKVTTLDNKIGGVVLSNVDDMNEQRPTGIYPFTTAPANSPEGLVYGVLIHVLNKNTNEQQYVMKGGAGQIYMRSLASSSPRIWGSWYKFTGTVVS